MEINSVSALEKQLQSRVAEQTETAERIVSDELQNLSDRLRRLSAQELSTIYEGMLHQIEQTKRFMKFGWLKMFMVTVAVLLGIGVGSWGLTAYMTHRIQSLRAELVEIKAQHQGLSLLPVEIYEQDGAQYLIFRTSQKPKFQETKDGRWAVKVK